MSEVKIPRQEAVEAGLAAGTMLDAPQLDWLYYLARTAPDGPAVEVGVWKGGSILCWARSRVGRGAFYAVDSWYGKQESKVRDRFLANRKASGLRITLRSQEGYVAAEHFHDGTVAFCFIDACHDEDGIGKDLPAWVPKIAPGGVLAFHDYGTHKCPAVKKVVDAWQAEARWEPLGIVGSAIAFRRPTA